MALKTPPVEESFDEARERIHREMLSSVSHDLKTPLSTVIGSLEIYTRMGAKLSEEKRAQLIASALTEAYRLDSFITNILDMAKLEGGNIKLKNERCDLSMLLEDSLIRLGPRRERGMFTLRPEGESTIVYTDVMLLSRAVGFLLDNALKHGGKNPHILISYGRGEEGGFIRVQDNGPGIPVGRHEDIFSKYTRYSKSDQQNAGTGLGLAICRQIMQLLSGSVEVQNHQSGGAEFVLLFPSSAN